VEDKGMKFEEVLPDFRAGKRIEITGVQGKYHKDISRGCELSIDLILSGDFEIVKEKVKKTLWVNVFQGSLGFVTDGIHDSRVDAALTSCQFDMPHLGIYSIEVEVEE
jgi:hypothetical protein